MLSLPDKTLHLPITWLFEDVKKKILFNNLPKSYLKQVSPQGDYEYP